MNKKEEVKADQHDQDNHLPKDVLNLEQDPRSFKDPLEQQLEKQQANNTNQSESRENKSSED